MRQLKHSVKIPRLLCSLSWREHDKYYEVFGDLETLSKLQAGLLEYHKNWQVVLIDENGNEINVPACAERDIQYVREYGEEAWDVAACWVKDRMMANGLGQVPHD